MPFVCTKVNFFNLGSTLEETSIWFDFLFYFSYTLKGWDNLVRVLLKGYNSVRITSITCRSPLVLEKPCKCEYESWL